MTRRYIFKIATKLVHFRTPRQTLRIILDKVVPIEETKLQVTY